MDEIDQKDDGYIELVLRVLARMCDGQHRGLQVKFVHMIIGLDMGCSQSMGDQQE